MNLENHCSWCQGWIWGTKSIFTCTRQFTHASRQLISAMRMSSTRPSLRALWNLLKVWWWWVALTPKEDILGCCHTICTQFFSSKICRNWVNCLSWLRKLCPGGGVASRTYNNHLEKVRLPWELRQPKGANPGMQIEIAYSTWSLLSWQNKTQAAKKQTTKRHPEWPPYPTFKSLSQPQPYPSLQTPRPYK